MQPLPDIFLQSTKFKPWKLLYWHSPFCFLEAVVRCWLTAHPLWPTTVQGLTPLQVYMTESRDQESRPSDTWTSMPEIFVWRDIHWSLKKYVQRWGWLVESHPHALFGKSNATKNQRQLHPSSLPNLKEIGWKDHCKSNEPSIFHCFLGQ